MKSLRHEEVPLCVGNSGVHRHNSQIGPGLRERKRVYFDFAIPRAGAVPMGIPNQNVPLQPL